MWEGEKGIFLAYQGVNLINNEVKNHSHVCHIFIASVFYV